MLISKITPGALATLNVWDKTDQWVDGQVVWFDTEMMMASVIIAGVEQRVQVSVFSFNCSSNEQVLEIPKTLQQYIVVG